MLSFIERGAGSGGYSSRAVTHNNSAPTDLVLALPVLLLAIGLLSAA